MARLVISIYPDHSTEEQDIAYIRKAGKLGYKRIFTCLLSVGEKGGEEIIGQYFQGWESPMRTCLCSGKCMWTASGWTRVLTA
mgnify:CR=1 FL=1